LHGYRINKDIGLVVVKYIGETATKEISEMLAAIGQDPDYSRSFNLFSDLRQLTSTYSYEELQAVVAKLPEPGELAGKTKSAIVVAKNVTYGVARIWASITEDRTVANAQVFWSPEAALEWLGLPPDAEIEFPF
jgi:hypothetical protein